jgi:hypothetical protein
MVEIAADEDASPVASTDDSSSNVDSRVLAGHPPQAVADVWETYRDRPATIDRANWLDRLLAGRTRFVVATDRFGPPGRGTPLSPSPVYWAQGCRHCSLEWTVCAKPRSVSPTRS